MINNLQALRVFAALNVVLFHILGAGNIYGYAPILLAPLSGWGGNGVDLFFVISGFVMVFIQSRHSKSVSEFIVNRIKRILPLYWSMTALLVMLLYLVPSVFRQIVFDPEQVIYSFLFISKLFGFEYPVLSPGWTLEFELLFYVLFGLSIFLKRLDTVIITSVLLLLLVLSHHVNTMVIEFIFGMIAAKFYLKGYFKSRASLFFMMGTVGLLGSIFFKLDCTRVMLWGVPSFFLVLSASYLPQTQNRLLIFLGNASFSIYLTHTFSMLIFFKIIRFCGLSTQYADLWVIFNVLFSVLMGSLCYHFYEKPLGICISHFYLKPGFYRGLNRS